MCKPYDVPSVSYPYSHSFEVAEKNLTPPDSEYFLLHDIRIHSNVFHRWRYQLFPFKVVHVESLDMLLRYCVCRAEERAAFTSRVQEKLVGIS